MDLGIAGRSAAVAAASRGLGFATARALAAEGVRVAICGRDARRLEAAAAEIGAVPIVADLRDPAAGATFVRRAADALGGLDILVTNTGGPPPGDFAAVGDLDAYRQAFDAACLSAVAMCREAVPGMQARRWGRIVAITSVAVRQPIPNLILSNVARAGLTGFLKTLAREVAADGITVNSLQPGYHATERVRELHADPAALAVAVPAGVIGDPADFGAVAAFCCSEQARFLTGAAIPVDGGTYAGLL